MFLVVCCVLRSGSAHSDLALAVDVRAAPSAIGSWRLRWRGGGGGGGGRGGRKKL